MTLCSREETWWWCCQPGVLSFLPPGFIMTCLGRTQYVLLGGHDSHYIQFWWHCQSPPLTSPLSEKMSNFTKSKKLSAAVIWSWMEGPQKWKSAPRWYCLVGGAQYQLSMNFCSLDPWPFQFFSLSLTYTYTYKNILFYVLNNSGSDLIALWQKISAKPLRSRGSQPNPCF